MFLIKVGYYGSMILYHGSRKKLDSLKAYQATTVDDPKSLPEGELLHAIYLTPNFEFALAMGARPYGHIRIDNNEITFENPELFDPNSDVYIYEFDDSEIEAQNLRRVDAKQYAVVGVEQLTPTNIQHLKSRELIKYYKLMNWQEQSGEMKRR